MAGLMCLQSNKTATCWRNVLPALSLSSDHIWFSGCRDGAGIKGRHCKSRNHKAATNLLENRPHHCGSDEQGQFMYMRVVKERISVHVDF